MSKFAPPAPPFIPARWHGGSQTPRGIVIHGTVSPCVKGGARAVARFFATETGKTSAHYVVDPAEVIQCVGDHSVAYHCGYNTGTIAVELCDSQTGPGARWDDDNHKAMLAGAARLVADLCLAYDIDPTRPSTADLQAKGPHGIYGHNDSRLAFGHTTHSDPGPDFPWRDFLGEVRRLVTEAKIGQRQTDARKDPGKAWKDTKTPKRPELTIITANFWRENKHAEEDAQTLASSKAHVIGLNEARGFYPILSAVDGYRLINPDGTGAQDQNPILLRDDVPFLGQGARKMCDGVGPSPERWATWVLYEFAGQKRAHINTHTNAHIENAGKPRVLPRVTQDVGHMKRLASLVRELRAQGYKVTVGGDLNWAWTAAAAWYWAPKRVFKRLGMSVNWEAKNAPLGGSKGNRRIDYLAHDPADLTIASQCFVRGEHSDHRWPEVTYRIKGA